MLKHKLQGLLDKTDWDKMRVSVVLLFPLMAGILELLVASLDRVAAGGRGAEHVDQWYRYLANHEIQVHLALNLWHLDAVSRLCSHLSLPYEGITVCCVTDMNDIFINVMLSIFCQERLPKIWLDDINMRNVDIRGFDDWHGIWPRCPLAPWRHWHKMPPLSDPLIGS